MLVLLAWLLLLAQHFLDLVVQRYSVERLGDEVQPIAQDPFLANDIGSVTMSVRSLPSMLQPVHRSKPALRIMKALAVYG